MSESNLLKSRGNKPRKGAVFNCSLCDKSFYVRPCHVRAERKHRFCCNEHRVRFQKENSFFFYCTVCGKQKKTQPFQMTFRLNPTCSISCRDVLKRAEAEWRRKNLGYTQHQLDRLARYSPEAELWRKAVFARDDYTCQMCGVRNRKGNGYTVRLEADHIKPFAYFPDIRYDVSNGRTLCRPCHDTTKMNYRKMREIYKAKDHQRVRL